MKPPRTVKVGPHTYRVRMIDDGVLSDAGRVGQCTAQSLTIAICKDQAPSQLRDTLLHELTHALLNQLDMDKDQEELVASTFGPGLLALIVDNPDLIRFVTGGTK